MVTSTGLLIRPRFVLNQVIEKQHVACKTRRPGHPRANLGNEGRGGRRATVTLGTRRSGASVAASRGAPRPGCHAPKPCENATGGAKRVGMLPHHPAAPTHPADGLHPWPFSCCPRLPCTHQPHSPSRRPIRQHIGQRDHPLGAGSDPADTPHPGGTRGRRGLMGTRRWQTRLGEEVGPPCSELVGHAQHIGRLRSHEAPPRDEQRGHRVLL